MSAAKYYLGSLIVSGVSAGIAHLATKGDADNKASVSWGVGGGMLAGLVGARALSTRQGPKVLLGLITMATALIVVGSETLRALKTAQTSNDLYFVRSLNVGLITVGSVVLVHTVMERMGGRTAAVSRARAAWRRARMSTDQLA